MNALINFYEQAVKALQQYIEPLVLLAARLWVANVFWKSGYLKVTTWDSTLYLFKEEYQVPLIPWELAAYLATAAELVLPIFFVLGLLTRPVAIGLFMVNMVAVISYPVLWKGGFYDHQLWGALILMNIMWGAGKISVDHLLTRKNNRLDKF
ncbi:DoxX family protein [Psychromonas algicola]|uniref:DoxX family protein n=1 Tax=Psychromonas algicola TaxID=2555642 RepID=UPI0010689D83|nr:DoxX family protein [Psychromonas sp. RZ5]TEW52528.1 DoxX family protein [Psychromonas sp. RZ5]